MERYTKRLQNGVASWAYPNDCYGDDEVRNKVFKSVHRQNACEKLAAIEDILGDEYDLDRLRELAEAYKNKCVIITPYPISEGVIEHDPVKLYRIVNNKAKPFEVDSLSISDGECTFEPCEPEHDGMRYGRENMGKDVFVSCIDAEAALRREQDG